MGNHNVCLTDLHADYTRGVFLSQEVLSHAGVVAGVFHADATDLDLGIFPWRWKQRHRGSVSPLKDTIHYSEKQQAQETSVYFLSEDIVSVLLSVICPNSSTYAIYAICTKHKNILN